MLTVVEQSKHFHKVSVLDVYSLSLIKLKHLNFTRSRCFLSLSVLPLFCNVLEIFINGFIVQYY